MPFYSQETLSRMKIIDLQEICRTYGIRQGITFEYMTELLGKKKADYVEHIWARVSTLYQNKNTVEAIKQHLQMVRIGDPAPLHSFYRDWFNLVDLADRLWYAVEENHGTWSWKFKAALSIMKYFMINVWSRSILEEWQDWKDFRANLAVQLVQVTTN